MSNVKRAQDFGFPPNTSEMVSRFEKYTRLPGRFVPMVLPSDDVVEVLKTAIISHNLSGVLSVGCGGRLDLERRLAHVLDGCTQDKVTIACVDWVPPEDVVSETVDYHQVDSHVDLIPCSAGMALMFCWGTSAPWQRYVDAYAESSVGRDGLVIVFSANDSRVESHPNPTVASDLAVFTNHGFVCDHPITFTGDAFWLNESRCSLFSRRPL